jgi:dihydrofolate reductase
MKISIIAAVSSNGVIGTNNTIPWHVKEDMTRFKELTTGKVIIMGRKTYESLPKGALPNRANVVITSTKHQSELPNCHVFSTIESAMEYLAGVTEVFIIGGASLYEKFLPIADTMYLTEVHENFAGDVTFPKFEHENWIVKERIDNLHAELPYTFLTLTNVAKNTATTVCDTASVEIGTCEVCGKQNIPIHRKYYNYNAHCDCHSQTTLNW